MAETSTEALARVLGEHRPLIRQALDGDADALGILSDKVFKAGVRWGYDAGYEDGFKSPVKPKE